MTRSPIELSWTAKNGMKYCLKKDHTKNDYAISSSSNFFISILEANIFDFWWLIMIRYGPGSELFRVCALWGEGVLN